MLALVFTANAADVTGRIVKVLPHYLDKAGRISLSPSLFERDAYQAELRQDPSKRSGIRFDIQWKVRNPDRVPLTLRTELVTTRYTKISPLVIESPVEARSGRSRWTSHRLAGDAFREAGELIAWRVTLWAANTLIAEQKSFLW
ncbi:MAG: hypothetical protein N3G20_07305 [Verrucomicrobiae bacterium]|nr:hypothetical protein [Verrucomicrobiae bacterium]